MTFWFEIGHCGGLSTKIVSVLLVFEDLLYGGNLGPKDESQAIRINSRFKEEIPAQRKTSRPKVQNPGLKRKPPDQRKY